MSIYQKVLQDDFAGLHPRLRQRYSFEEQHVFKASGTMTAITGAPKWLVPFIRHGTKRKLLFPESGTDIPFTITNTALAGPEGEPQVHWERKFFFPDTVRYFNALMSLDEKSLLVKDYLGEPPLLYSDLQFAVTDEGALKINSVRQRIIIGRIELPLPRFLHGLAEVTEMYEEKNEVFRVSVSVRNPLIGRIFAYEGVFTPDA